MKQIIALQQYTDKFISLYQGEIRNIQNSLADKLIEEGIVAEHDQASQINTENLITRLQDGNAPGSIAAKSSLSNQSYTMGENAVAFGYSSQAKGKNSFAEGQNSQAKGENSHAQGSYTYAEGNNAHAQGSHSQARGLSSHAQGTDTYAEGYNSHVQGLGTFAKGYNSHVQGVYNKIDKTNTYAFIIGNGYSDEGRSNAFAMKWDGTFVFANGTEITPAQFASLLALLS